MKNLYGIDWVALSGLGLSGTGYPGRCPGLALGRTVGAKRAAAIATHGHNQIRPRPNYMSAFEPPTGHPNPGLSLGRTVGASNTTTTLLRRHLRVALILRKNVPHVRLTMVHLKGMR